MPIEDHSPQPPTRRDRTRLSPVLAVITAAVAVGLLIAALMTRGDEEIAGASPNESSAATPTVVATTTTVDARSEVVARLREILRTREEAFRKRDASLFEEIYASDCPCREGGRKAIAQLLKDDAIWEGRSTSIEIRSVSRINDRLWEVFAIFSSKPFRIESEDGTLIRTVPSERQLYRFLLVRPVGGGPWLLGRASFVEGG